jgi:hypothetical protein
MQICYSIILSIPQTTDKRVYMLRECFFNVLHDVCLDVVSFLEDLFFYRLEEFLRLHQNRPFYSYKVLDVLL